MAGIERDRARGQLKWPVVAVDPARYGPDKTCMAIRRGDVLERLETWGGLSTMETADRVVEEVKEYGVRPHTDHGPAWGELVVDGVGLGAGVADRLRQLAFSVNEFNGGFKAGKRDKFLNGRAESFWHLRTRLEAGKIALPLDEQLFSELLAINWKETSAGQVQLESKMDLKNRLGHSPDRADAVSMAFYQGAGHQLRIGTFHF